MKFILLYKLFTMSCKQSRWMNKELIIKTSNNHNKKLKEFYKSHLSYYPINWKDNLGKHTLLFTELFLIINIL